MRSPLSLARGGIRLRGDQPKIRFAAVNATSMKLHWKSVADIESDFLLVTETRITQAEQTIITNGLARQDWRTTWGPPINIRPPGGMAGRSGGTGILHRPHWICREPIELECEAPQHHLQGHYFENEHTGSVVGVVVYYGHPEMRDTTGRDAARIASMVNASQIDMVVGGDFNISDEDEDSLPTDGAWIDTHAWWSAMHQTPLAATFHTGRTARRIDRIFISSALAQFMVQAEVSDMTYLPGHSVVMVAFENRNIKRRVQVARPCLVREEYQCDPATTQAAADTAWEAWCNIPLSYDVDELYRLWSHIWERYLRTCYNHSMHEPQTKGKVVPPRTTHASPMQMKLSHWMRRLANYLNLLRRVRVRVARDQPNIEQDWTKLVRSSIPIAHRYGTPPLDGDYSLSNKDLTLAVLDSSYEFYNKVWRAELRQSRFTAATQFKTKLAAHNGINKTVSRLLRPQPFHVPRIQQDNEIIADPSQVVHLTQQAWQQYFAKEPEPPNEAWLEVVLHLLPHRDEQPIPNLDPEELRAIVKSKKTNSAPGPDSWYLAELKQLPLQAYHGLCQILTRAEHHHRLPVDLTNSWMALIAKTNEPGKPTSIRPISVLSTVYRSWASLRACHLQTWAQATYHPWQLAFVKGRTPRKQLALLSVTLDRARKCGDSCYVASLDASKAFPSINRKQAASLLAHTGYPLDLIQAVESHYQQGETHMRYSGSIIDEEAFKVRSGVHQGCPLSVLCFNIILAPLCHMMEKELGITFGIIFADDITFIAHSREHLEHSLDKIVGYLDKVNIDINRSKTQIWSALDQEEVNVAGEYVKPRNDFKILGMTYSPGRIHKGERDHMMNTYARLAMVLGNLPMSLAHRANAAAGIALTAAMYCPWNLHVEMKYMAKVRKHLLQAVLPYMVRGCRAAPILTNYAIKGHLLDPITSPLMRMLKMISELGMVAAIAVEEAFATCDVPASLASSFAAGIRRLGGWLDRDGWHSPLGEVLPLCGPRPGGTKEHALWQHTWRTHLRQLVGALSAGHRHEFKELKSMMIDEKLTFHLLRHTKPGRDRAAIEVALSGGLLTKARTAHSKGPREKACQWGCGVEDSDHHRYWSCTRWQASRGNLAELIQELPDITKSVGWFCVDSGCSLSFVLRVQRHMAHVVQTSTRDFQTMSRGKYDPASDLLDPGTDSEEPGPGMSDAVASGARCDLCCCPLCWAPPGGHSR